MLALGLSKAFGSLRALGFWLLGVGKFRAFGSSGLGTIFCGGVLRIVGVGALMGVTVQFVRFTLKPKPRTENLNPETLCLHGPFGLCASGCRAAGL